MFPTAPAQNLFIFAMEGADKSSQPDITLAVCSRLLILQGTVSQPHRHPSKQSGWYQCRGNPGSQQQAGFRHSFQAALMENEQCSERGKEGLRGASLSLSIHTIFLTALCRSEKPCCRGGQCEIPAPQWWFGSFMVFYITFSKITIAINFVVFLNPQNPFNQNRQAAAPGHYASAWLLLLLLLEQEFADKWRLNFQFLLLSPVIMCC